MIRGLSVGLLAIGVNRLVGEGLKRLRKSGADYPAWLDDVLPSVAALAITVVAAEVRRSIEDIPNK